MNWTPYGNDAILVHFATKSDETALQRSRSIVQAFEQHTPRFVKEFVPGHTSILFELELLPGSSLTDLATEIVAICTEAIRHKLKFGAVKRIPVRYDGPDLERVAKHNGISVEQVIKYHCATTYKAYLVGFAPGFAYLGDLHAKLVTPRHAEPRPLVRAGSVAIGSTHTGIYSVDTPGGWNIIGWTACVVYDRAAAARGDIETAFYIRQGDQVQFYPAP